ncbi:hypothetical protein [Falsiroseomonas sp.]|uniref:hypothetical protein n=1 Tax=Falsiroseomonas sp. TaxID=2870721 RepID=UPI003566EE5A
MRRILLVLITLSCAIPAAEAATRDATRGEAASRPAQQAGKQARPQAARQQASRQQATRQRSARQATQRRAALRPGDVRTSRSGVVVRGASAATVSRQAASSCTRRNGRRVCAPARSSIAGWQRGLPVANYTQRECPEGTLATLARGHDDVVRCMPL